MTNAKDPLSKVVLLPREDISLEQVTREITYEKLKNWIGSASMKDTAVVLHLLQLRLNGCHNLILYWQL